MENFTPVSGLVGGLLIGTSAALLLMLTGRIAGISGILGSALDLRDSDAGWRLAFLAGLVAAPIVYANLVPVAIEVAATPVLLVAAGLLVGFGTRLGSGCTSGHGVCGISRLSARGIVATATFMAFGVATVFVMRHLLGA
ncbi:YeeE/YedE family protein [Parvibaculum sp.]|uniref:YeeE/YedE family protein n=1 Tax=Parvibaculum sp. TaxID=2024848 RepID=UPI001B003F95|nr:YeeE/YedE family protein [Parvibaculum sp.]MBO6635821.1 YeeE/YedE family protein [Parvibaculum sp.]MBO6679204.1 YeeE/YedE family protein [Parvibaculum sp.]MBO6685930.1 YeeE/YedE family protein [Parvibaculum sp.]MBO6905958.1 YeeE/YedE family protein [Parvibaculum sp.]